MITRRQISAGEQVVIGEVVRKLNICAIPVHCVLNQFQPERHVASIPNARINDALFSRGCYPDLPDVGLPALENGETNAGLPATPITTLLHPAQQPVSYDGSRDSSDFSICGNIVTVLKPRPMKGARES